MSRKYDKYRNKFNQSLKNGDIFCDSVPKWQSNAKNLLKNRIQTISSKLVINAIGFEFQYIFDQQQASFHLTDLLTLHSDFYALAEQLEAIVSLRSLVDRQTIANPFPNYTNFPQESGMSHRRFNSTHHRFNPQTLPLIVQALFIQTPKLEINLLLRHNQQINPSWLRMAVFSLLTARLNCRSSPSVLLQDIIDNIIHIIKQHQRIPKGQFVQSI